MCLFARLFCVFAFDSRPHKRVKTESEIVLNLILFSFLTFGNLFFIISEIAEKPPSLVLTVSYSYSYRQITLG